MKRPHETHEKPRTISAEELTEVKGGDIFPHGEVNLQIVVTGVNPLHWSETVDPALP